MGIEVDSLKSLTTGGGTSVWAGSSVLARHCDSCKTAAAAAFCKVDSVFLCLNCDTKIHHQNPSIGKLLLSRPHERVWLCEVCEQAPAAVTCRADAAALCVTCDADIHSANPLSRRHERVPIQPFFDSSESIIKSSPFRFLVPNDDQKVGENNHMGGDGGGGGSWLFPCPVDANSKQLGVEENNYDRDMKSGDLFFGDMDPFLEFEYQNSIDDGRFHLQHHGSMGTDGVVPVQTKSGPQPPPPPLAAATGATIPVINNENCFDIDLCRSKLTSFNYPSHSLSQSVSSSSLDFGVVPDGSSISDISYPFGRNMNTGADPSVDISAAPASTAATNQGTQMGRLDREARVMRYRERRKNRKFEKTIRYASRKAYAETRPRIKGRFAKRTEIESDVDPLCNSPSSVPFAADTQYGVVPSF